MWQDFPAGDGRALPLWDAARGVLEQPHGCTAGDETECKVSTRGKWDVCKVVLALVRAPAHTRPRRE